MAIETLFRYKGKKKGDETFLIEKLKHFDYFYTEKFEQYSIIFNGKMIWGHCFSDDESESTYNYFDVKYESAFRNTPEEIQLFIEKMKSLGFEVNNQNPMNFLKKLFGFSLEETSKENPKTKLRDTLKNEKYFRKELERLDEWFNDSLKNDEEYKQQHGGLTPYHYHSRSYSKFKRIRTMYSLGLAIDEIIPVYNEMQTYYFKGFEENHSLCDEDDVNFVCFAILLEIPCEEFQKIKNFIYDCDKKGFKVHRFLFYLLGDKSDLSQKPKGEKYYYGLYKIAQLSKPEAEKALKKYLDQWYEMHQHEAWYNTHHNNWGYSGYWAWEVAALVKMMDLDDSSFKAHPYYPYDLAHWKK